MGTSSSSLQSPLSDHGGVADAEMSPHSSSGSSNSSTSGRDDGGSSKVKSFWVQFDRSYMQPFFGGHSSVSLMSVCEAVLDGRVTLM